MDHTPVHHHLEGLMTFLSVARLGRFTAAGESLGVNHSTVSRRIRSLETALGGRVLVRTPSGWEVTDIGRRAMASAESIERSLAELTSTGEGGAVTGMVRIAAPDAFCTHFAAPALAALQRRNPGLVVELLSATKRVQQNRSGVDLEIVIGRPVVHRAVAEHVLDYRLGLYATADYLGREGTPGTLAGVRGHRINYYVESVLDIDELDRAMDSLPPTRRGINSTSVFAHVEATAAGAGIGILPTFLAEGRAGLIRLLPAEFDHPASYYAVAREEALRNPVVMAAFAALRGDPPG